MYWVELNLKFGYLLIFVWYKLIVQCHWNEINFCFLKLLFPYIDNVDRVRLRWPKSDNIKQTSFIDGPEKKCNERWKFKKISPGEAQSQDQYFSFIFSHNFRLDALNIFRKFGANILNRTGVMAKKAENTGVHSPELRSPIRIKIFYVTLTKEPRPFACKAHFASRSEACFARKGSRFLSHRT